ncbi:MAG: multicopper oxidase family protein [Vicinamibacterales bacterium]
MADFVPRPDVSPHRGWSRRAWLATGAAGIAGLAASRLTVPLAASGPRTHEVRLVARPVVRDVGGRSWSTWANDGPEAVPMIRVRRGDRVRVTVENHLPEPTTVHWHGVPVPNAVDGVPGLTQDPIAPGDTFVYDFLAEPAGTYFFHSHVGLQLDRGLMGALVIEDDVEPLAAERPDAEHVIVLDDWLPGSPEDAYAQLGGVARGMMSRLNSPPYEGYLVNGRLGTGEPLDVGRGTLVRLRLINASAATVMRVGLAGHRLTVTHADGQPVRPVVVDTLTLGMGERYDVLVRADNPGAWPLLAGPAGSVVPSASIPFVYDRMSGVIAPVVVWPRALLQGEALSYADLVPRLPLDGTTRPDRVLRLALGMAPGPGYGWTINGQRYPDADAIPIASGETIRLAFENWTMMPHPMHLHGHFFQLRHADGSAGPLKDTAVVYPMQRVEADFTAGNPGRWFLHCHHAYHMEGGMARELRYTS